MIRTVTLAGRDVEVNTSMGWLYLYRNQFGRDILPDIMPIIEAVLAGLGDMLTTIQESGGGGIKADDAVKLMNSDTIVEMFIKMAGMELTTVFNIFWAMAKNRDAKTKEPMAFMNSFERMPVDELAPALLYMIVDSSVSSKNAQSLLPNLEKVTQSVLTSSPSQEQTEG